ncbi:hypothetical protein PISMIDRAFT_689501 [Pisolithus microcarpus 441]|uniref:Uncharacterized protein n=1 Tax=Pisolithus microcarpus 441 TaxID=765257 RepID=A0A0C9XJC3_9AGAM|nr:hypothetical protein PISMIDRAFT_689501 [Pisolithus microcarpus 441]
MSAMQSPSWKLAQHVPPLHECLFAVLQYVSGPCVGPSTKRYSGEVHPEPEWPV